MDWKICIKSTWVMLLLRLQTQNNCWEEALVVFGGHCDSVSTWELSKYPPDLECPETQSSPDSEISSAPSVTQNITQNDITSKSDHTIP
eukprot:scaffold412_cov118-Skeletonema_marinoi.AAC.4